MTFPKFTVAEWLDLITAVAIVLGVCGGAWKWFFADALRRRREVPSIDGTVRFELTPQTKGSFYLAIRFIWNNRSIEPVYLDPQKATVHIFALDTVGLQTISLKTLLGDGNYPVCSIHPLSGFKYVMLEPGASSEIEAYASVEAGRSYFMYSIFPIDSRKHKKKWSWSRTRLIQTRFLTENEGS